MVQLPGGRGRRITTNLRPAWDTVSSRSALWEKSKQEIPRSLHSYHGHLRHLLLDKSVALTSPELNIGNYEVTTPEKELSSCYAVPYQGSLLHSAILRLYLESCEEAEHLYALLSQPTSESSQASPTNPNPRKVA